MAITSFKMLSEGLTEEIATANKAQDITTSGYWGDIDTTTTFCEANYSLSPYFAEFFNAWSSLVYVVVGIYIIRKFPNDKCWMLMGGLWLVAIGLGSFCFHATMRYSMQLTDELPMVGFIWTMMMHKTMSKQHPVIQKYATSLQVLISLQAVVVVALYTYFELYEIFLHGFTFMVVNNTIFGFFLKSVGPHVELKKKVNLYSLCLIIGGKAVWELERQFCDRLPVVWPLHTVWHFLSAGSAYNACFFNYLCCPDDDDETVKPSMLGWATKNTKKAKNS